MGTRLHGRSDACASLLVEVGGLSTCIPLFIPSLSNITYELANSYRFLGQISRSFLKQDKTPMVVRPTFKRRDLPCGGLSHQGESNVGFGYFRGGLAGVREFVSRR